MIVTSTDIIRDTIPINRNHSFNSLKPFVMQVEGDIAVNVLGADLYNVLDTSPTLTPEQEKLLEYARAMISAFAVYYGAGVLNIHISELGFQQQNSQEGTSNPADIWRYNEAKHTVFRMADSYREMCYKYLQANQPSFPEWVASSSYTIFNELLVKSNEEIHSFIGKGENINTFRTLKPFLLITQNKYLTSVLCSDYLQYLLQEQAPTNYDKQVKNYACGALAWYGLAEALPTLRATVIDGTLVTSIPQETSKVYTPLSNQEIENIKLDAKAKGDYFLSNLKQYLLDNATNIPNYYNSTCYQSLLNASQNSFIHKTGSSLGLI